MAKKIRSEAGGTAKKIKATYDAVNYRGRRRVVATDTRTEDRILRPQDRDKLISDARALRRNAPEVGWMVRRHLDYVSTFSFQCRTGIPELDKEIDGLMTWWSRPLNCDALGRFPLSKIIRMAESLRTVDGDCLIYKLDDGTVQLIEGDRVRTPTDLGDYKGNFNPEDFQHGVVVNQDGKPVAYAICERVSDGKGYRLLEVVKARDVLHHGYWDRYEQIRGVSPLASALNQFFDLYESREYALAKMKLSQLFALKVKRSEAFDYTDGAITNTEPLDLAAAQLLVAQGVDPNAIAGGAAGHRFDFGKGPQMLDLDPGDDADFLESQTPSTEFQAFWQTGLQVGLKALDIPFSFYSENYTNYSGARQALLQYEQSADDKRADNIQILNSLTAWRIGMWIADGELVLPAGKTIQDIKWEWIAAGIPWIDPQKEASADQIRLQLRMASRQGLCKERGQDWFAILDQIADEEAYAKAKGIDLAIANVGTATQVITDEDTDTQPNKAA